MTKKPSIQFVTDETGKKQAVLIPIQEWINIQKEIQELREYNSLKKSLSTALLEVRQMQKGQIPKTSLSSFLDEC